MNPDLTQGRARRSPLSYLLAFGLGVASSQAAAVQLHHLTDAMFWRYVSVAAQIAGLVGGAWLGLWILRPLPTTTARISIRRILQLSAFYVALFVLSYFAGAFEAPV